MTRSSLTGTTQVWGIIGYPVEHSLSPPMQNAALAQLAINGVYVPFPVEPATLESAITGLWSLGVQGFNVTLPHKQAVIPYLTSVTDLSQAVGAVNTVWRVEMGWTGTNTDVTGFIAPLQHSDRDWSQARVVVLGNGGAARAVVAGCVTLGCAELWLVGRSANKLQNFVESWQASPLKRPLHTGLTADLDALLPSTTLLVNTTPIGMHPHVEASPVTAQQMELLPINAIAYDLIYTPSPTQFLQLASRRGLQTFDGTEMLVQQGAAALQIWTQQPPPVDLMRQTLRAQLGLA
ncbi:MAG: shikimate dehydrogenase [Cyanobacteria bacterium P01_F01_bin.56]